MKTNLNWYPFHILLIKSEPLHPAKCTLCSERRSLFCNRFPNFITCAFLYRCLGHNIPHTSLHVLASPLTPCFWGEPELHIFDASVVPSIDIHWCMEALDDLLICWPSRTQCIRILCHVVQYEMHFGRDCISWEVYGEPIPETDCSSRQLSDLHDQKMQSARLHVVSRQVDHWSLESQFNLSRPILLNQFDLTTQSVSLGSFFSRKTDWVIKTNWLSGMTEIIWVSDMVEIICVRVNWWRKNDRRRKNWMWEIDRRRKTECERLTKLIERWDWETPRACTMLSDHGRVVSTVPTLWTASWTYSTVLNCRTSCMTWIQKTLILSSV